MAILQLIHELLLERKLGVKFHAKKSFLDNLAPVEHLSSLLLG